MGMLGSGISAPKKDCLFLLGEGGEQFPHDSCLKACTDQCHFFLMQGSWGLIGSAKQLFPNQRIKNAVAQKGEG